MEWFPYILGFSLVFSILSYGLMKRPAWMWYLGWVILYLIAGYLGTFFYGALFEASNAAQEASTLIYLAGGLLLWAPWAVWWANHRHLFGPKRSRPQPPGPAEATPKTSES